MRRIKWGLTPFLFLAALAVAQDLPSYHVVEDGSPDSARGAARQLLAHLAKGEIADAAALSNSPRRRHEVLKDYREAIGADEFKRIFSRYLEPANPLLAELAVGERRLLLWKLGEAQDHIAAQYYVRVEGRFLMDDVPSEERSQLRKLLDAARSGKLAIPGRSPN